MIVSKYGKSYDQSDGSEQPHAATSQSPERSEREEINRWEDDGPGPHTHACLPATDVPRKPAWSVSSLRNLLEAVRDLRRADVAPPSSAGNGTPDRNCLPAGQCREVSAAADRPDPYRNHWENT